MKTVCITRASQRCHMASFSALAMVGLEKVAPISHHGKPVIRGRHRSERALMRYTRWKMSTRKFGAIRNVGSQVTSIESEPPVFGEKSKILRSI